MCNSERLLTGKFSQPHHSHLQPVVGPQTNNRAAVSAVTARIRAVRNTQELCLYSDSKWCVDIFSNLQLYERRNWVAKGKQPVRRHDIWEDIYQSLQSKTALVSMTHVYGHNKLVYNNAADARAKSTVHKTSRPRGPTDDGPRVRRQKHTRTQEVKRHTAVQVSDSDSGNDRPK